MAGLIRFLVGLLLGVILGAGGSVYLIGSGAGDFLIRRTHVVEELRRSLTDSEQQRDQLRRQLEDLTARAGRMEAAFADIERRFGAIAQDVERQAEPKAEP